MNECFEQLCTVPKKTYDLKLLVQRVCVIGVPVGGNKKKGCTLKIQIYSKCCIFLDTMIVWMYQKYYKGKLSVVSLYLLIK